ncbi:hypothetical protein C5B97_05610 [Pseudoclavibacter sp. RFBB5]|nr:hypothetical protein C5B97_05610 [Pseudoclavibacter sp. RFBB5]
MQVLLMFSEDRPKLTVEEVVKATGISMPSAYRYLSLLKELDLVEEKSYSRYALTPKLLALGRAAESAFAESFAIRPVLSELSALSGESALVMRRLRDSAVCADLIESNHTVRLSFTVGHTLPLHRGAAAKVLLAEMGEAWCDAYITRNEPDFAEQERRRLLHELALIRERGWAQSASEVDEGIWAVAAPIRSGGRAVAAVTVAGPRYRIDPDQAQSIHTHVLAAAAKLSQHAS